MGKKIKQIEIEAFRGYEKKAIFDFTQNSSVADLIVIHAPNGFGKTSFFEGVEWCLSSKLMRIERNKILQESEDKDRGFTLKNKNAIKTFGEVKIITNDQKIIHRQTKKSKITKKGFKDYGYENLVTNEVVKISFDITSHLLTQDGMDAFLRFTSSREKFDALTTFWNKGEETSEKYRQLKKLYTKVKDKIDSLDGDITKNRAVIESVQITQEEVDNVKKKLNTINAKLRHEKKVNFIFEKNIDTKMIVQFSNELKMLLANVEQEIKSLEEKKNKLEDIKTYLSQYKQTPKELNEIKKDIDSFTKLINKFKELELLENELKKINLEVNKSKINKEKIIRISGLYLKYQEIKREISALDNSLTKKNELKFELTKNKHKIERKFTRKDRILQCLGTTNELKRKDVEKVNLLLKQLMEIDLKKNDAQNKLNLEQKRYEEIHTKFKNTLNNKKQLEHDKLFIQMYNNDEYKISKNYKISYEELKDLLLKKEKLKQKVNNLIEKKNRTLALKNDVTKLITLGKSLIENTNTHICPLCNHDYEKHDALLKIVLINSIDILEIKQIENDIENETHEHNKIEKYFILKENSLIKLINDELTKLLISYTSINEDFKNKKNELNSITMELVVQENKIINCAKELKLIHNVDLNENSVKTINKEYNEIVERWLKDINILQLKESDYKKQIEILVSQKQKIDESIENLNSSLENNINERNMLETEPTFVEYNKLLQELNLLSKEQKKQINEKLTETKELLRVQEKKAIETHFKVNILKQELDKLEFDYIALQLKIGNLKMKEKELNDFIEKINKLLFSFNLSQDLDEEKLLSVIAESISNMELKNTFTKEIVVLDNIIQEFITDLDIEEKEKEIQEIKKQLKIEVSFLENVKNVKNKYKSFIEQTISECFNTKTINEIYNRIDPHPIQKEVKFIPELDESTKIRVKTSDSDGKEDDPTLYNSSGQISILSLSIFLAKALQTKDELDTIFMDDPIQYLDSINVLSFIDLLRTIITKEKRQIVISTHDKNFYQLLQKKLDSKYYNSKFIELESYGKIKSEDY